MKTQRMTAAQAIVKFLDNQYVSFDGKETKFIDGIATVFGHGIVLGLGQALDEDRGSLEYYQGKNEQGMAHMAAAFAKQHNRRKIIAVASSIGPGAANMITAAACASVNNIPLLLLPGDSFSIRQPDPVLQQVEMENNLTITTNDAFRPVCKYWDRINRPEQVMTAFINAMRVLTDPATTGAVCIAMPQDVQGECFDYPESFLTKRVHRMTRPCAVSEELQDAVHAIMQSKNPIVICGGGVRYSEAGQVLADFCEKFGIPFAETQSGKSAVASSHSFNLGGIGVTGNLAANKLAAKADCVIAVGSRLSDFTTASKWLFPENATLINVNISRYHAYKMDALKLVGDAKATLETLTVILSKKAYHANWGKEIEKSKGEWADEMNRLSSYHYDESFKTIVEAQNPDSISDFIKDVKGTLTQTEAICIIRKEIAPDAIIVGASGSLPGCLQRMWTTDARDSYHMEYGYSTMGYEIAGALGAKIAEPDKEVYAMTGDGSFIMLHSEFITAIQEKRKITILLFDNAGFGCINNLEMSNGVGNLGTEFRCKVNGEYTGDFMNIDYAAVAKGYGAAVFRAKNKDELEKVLSLARKEPGCVLIDMKVLPKTMTDGYQSWWHVGVAGSSKNPVTQESFVEKERERRKARPY